MQVYQAWASPSNKMNFQQVALAVLAFSSARGGTIEQRTAQQIAIVPPLGLARVIVEQDNQDSSSWYVRLVKGGRRALQPPVYFPAVTTQEGLQDALRKAWEFHLETSPPAPFLSRFLEPPTSSPPRSSVSLQARMLDSSSPPRSASPPRRRTGTERQTPPRPV